MTRMMFVRSRESLTRHGVVGMGGVPGMLAVFTMFRFRSPVRGCGFYILVMLCDLTFIVCAVVMMLVVFICWHFNL